MPQLLSSVFDTVVGVAVVLSVPCAAFTKSPPVIAIAVVAVLLASARVMNERRKHA